MADVSNSLLFSKQLYSQQAVLETAHSYTDKFFMNILDAVDSWKVEVNPKDSSAGVGNTFWAEFTNRLMEQQIRVKMDEEFYQVRDALVRKAFASMSNQ